MRCKVRTITRHRSGSVAQSEQRIETPRSRLILGRGTDSDIFLKDLRVSYHHAEIVMRDFDVVIEATGGSDLRVDDVPVDRAVIGPGSEIDVGPYRLQVLPDERDADLTLSLELVSPPPGGGVEALIDPRRTRLHGGLLGKRVWSWGLFIGAIAIGLVVPILAHRAPAPDPPTNAASDGLLAGFDRIWISGDLADSHRLLSRNCKACHESAFVQVRSEACASCHGDTAHHFEVARFEFAGFAPTRCTGCHTEHQGANGVVPAHQSLCADCHRDLSTDAEDTTLLDAADFGTAHPEFRPSVITDPASGEVERVALGAEAFPPERSNLRFPHDVHLAQACDMPEPAALEREDAEALKRRQACTVLQMARQRLEKEALACDDCHRPEPGGVNMLPVNMRNHCAECHRLEFDPAAPGRVLPHGEPEEVIATIRDFYIARAARGAPIAEPRQTDVRRRPGASDESSPQAAAPDPIRDAERLAAQKLDTVFGRSLCGVCHEITTPAQSDSGEWEVRPVRVAALWMPKARFDHGAHETTPCTDCHGAETSATSADVLMPRIADCRDCHGGERTTEALPSTCIMCHAYHREDQEPMLPGQTATTISAQ